MPLTNYSLNLQKAKRATVHGLQIMPLTCNMVDFDMSNKVSREIDESICSKFKYKTNGSTSIITGANKAGKYSRKRHWAPESSQI